MNQGDDCRRPTPGHRRLLSWTAAVSPLAIVVALWASSWKGWELTGFLFAGAGAVQTVTTSWGATVWTLSDIQAGPRRAWTLDLMLRRYGNGIGWPDNRSDIARWIGDDVLPIVLGSRPEYCVEHLLMLGDPDLQFPRRSGFSMQQVKSDAPLPGGKTALVVTIPFWFWGLVASVPLVRLGWRTRRRVRWVEGGRCGNCGYDLRATPNRCPECGAMPVGKSERLDHGKGP